MSSLPRQDTTVSSLSTSCSNLETSSDITSSIKCHNHRNKNDRKSKRNSYENIFRTYDPKTIKTLKVHYYPEEQYWSIFMIIIASFVHLFDDGMQLSYGIMLISINATFENADRFYITGKVKYSQNFIYLFLLVFLQIN